MLIDRHLNPPSPTDKFYKSQERELIGFKTEDFKVFLMVEI